MISNWALLAILTSVVSDNMINCSVRATAQESSENAKEMHRFVVYHLNDWFEMMDKDQLGFIDEREWDEFVEVATHRAELEAASRLSFEECSDLFACLADHDSTKKTGRLEGTPHRVLDYNLFIKEIGYGGKPAERKSVLGLMIHMRSMDRRLEERLDLIISRQNHEASK